MASTTSSSLAPSLKSPLSTPTTSTTNTPAEPSEPILPVSPAPLPHEEIQTWSFIRHAFLIDQIGLLRRTPSQLAAYKTWVEHIKKTHGSASNYLIRERLKWTPKEGAGEGGVGFDVQSPVPFENEADYKILRNDWPYGLEEGIVHLCVWLKGRLECEGPRGALTREARARVEEFVEETFTRPMLEADKKWGAVHKADEEESQDREWNLSWENSSNAGGDGKRVLWFKNWVELQSVKGIDHVHVLLRDPAPELVERWLK